MANPVNTINPMEYTFTPERIAVLEQYEKRVNHYNELEAQVRLDRNVRGSSVTASDIYHAFTHMCTFKDVHGITRREMTAFKSRNAVKCSSVGQAIEALTRMFGGKPEKAA